MLIQFKLSNFRSFNEEQTLSMVAAGGRDKTHPDNFIAPETVGSAKFRLLKTAAIYGANASGKSNLIKALRAMRKFVLESATRMNEGDPVRCAAPFRLASESKTRPSTFEITVVIAQVRYVYGFSVTSQQVEEEQLVVHPAATSKGQCWFHRRFDVSAAKHQWEFSGPLNAFGKVLEERTRQNGLALSRGAEQNIAELRPLFLWLRDEAVVMDLSVEPIGFVLDIASQILKDPVFKERVERMVNEADLGLDAVVVEERQKATKDVLPTFDDSEETKEFSGFLAKMWSIQGEFGTNIRTIHKGSEPDLREEFNFFSDESKGTQRFFALTGTMLSALDNGGLIVADEFDCSMHPLLTRKLVELFNSKEANQRGAQLIFATHDVSLLNPALFRRDQLWIVEKNAAGASQLFSLHDFRPQPRTIEAFWRGYLAGRYGGIPKFGPMLENLKVR